MTVKLIISGGQTGADQGGLAAGVKLDIPTGGWAPHGWRTDRGEAPWLEGLGLKEHDSPAYPPRTRCNIRDSDGTLVVTRRWSPGSRLTSNVAHRLRKPCLKLSMTEVTAGGDEVVERFQAWIKENQIQVLNVAGNRESVAPGITHATYDFLVRALS